MSRAYTGRDVLSEAIERMLAVYREGHRVVVSFSGGKDSCVTLEVCLIAAREAGRLPVDVVLQDEEVAFPGTYEYAERVAARPEVAFKWLVMNQPMINIYNRAAPYFWVFDPLLPPEQWVRQPPAWATVCEEKEIGMMTVPWRFPPPEGKGLFAAVGLRIQESRARRYGLFSSKGHITKPNAWGVRNIRPIYDWTDGDVWKAIRDNRWDYNDAYDHMHRMGIKGAGLRVAPPTMNAAGATLLGVGASLWPRWFEKVAARLPGVRLGAHYGNRCLVPQRRLDESWEQCYQRTCIDTAPEWIAARATLVRNKLLGHHRHHSSTPFPESAPCWHCHGNIGSWRALAHVMFNGDPFSAKTSSLLPWVEPEFFRPGAGKWIVGPGMAGL